MAATKRHVLVAEDDDASRTLLERYLEKNGFSVTSVADGELALAALTPGAGFDVVILDVMMPRRTGLDVLKAVREGGQTVPIIMATAVSSPEEIVAALDAGADDYVTKPYSFPVLLARMQARIRVRPQKPPPLPPLAAQKRAPPPASPNDGDDGRLVSRLKAFAGRFRKPAPPPLELVTGTKLSDRYEIAGPLGSGAFGTVYQARHVDLQQDVAVKVLTRSGPHGSADALRKEAQSACQVRHPNAVRVFDFGLLPPNSAFLVMELLEGSTLESALQKKGRLPPEVALSAVRGVLGALAVMHRQGLVHRDVKPSNVLMHREHGREVPKLIDFGTARAMDEDDEEAGVLMGSPAYVSPERIRGDDYDGRADVYSCGVMLYKLLTGALPIDGDTNDLDNVARWHLAGTVKPVSALRPGLSSAIDGLVARLLTKTPTGRPAAEEAERLVDNVVRG